MDHVKIEIGVGRFEAFTIIGSEIDSSAQESMAGALVWLSRRLIAAVMSTEVELINHAPQNQDQLASQESPPDPGRSSRPGAR